MSPAHKVRRYFIVVCLASIVFLAGLSWQLLTRWDVIRFSPAKAKEAMLGVHGHAATLRGVGVGVGVGGQALQLVDEERQELLPDLAAGSASRKLSPTLAPANNQRDQELVGGGGVGGRGGGEGGGEIGRGGGGGEGRGGSGPEGAGRSGKSVVMEQDADSGGRDQAAEEGSRTNHEGPRENPVADSGGTRNAASVDGKGGGGGGGGGGGSSLAKTHNTGSVDMKGGGGGSVAKTHNTGSVDMKGGGGGSVDMTHGAGSLIKTHNTGSVDTTDDAGSLAKTHKTGSLSKPRDAGSAAGSRNPPSKPGPAREPEPGPDRQEPEPDKPEAEAGKGEAEAFHHDSNRPETHRHSVENVGAGFESASLQSGRDSGAGLGGFQQGGSRGRVPETRRGTDSGARPLDKILRQSRLGASSLGADEAADLQQNHNNDFQRRDDTRNDLNGAANGLHDAGEKPDRSPNLGDEAEHRVDGLTDHDAASNNRGPGEKADLSRNLGDEVERRRGLTDHHDDKPRAREEKNFPLHPTPVLPAAAGGARAKTLSKTDDGEGEGFHDNPIQKRPDPLGPRSEKRNPAALKATDDYHDAGLRRQTPKPQAPEESSNSGSRQSYDEQRRTADFTHGAGGSGGSNRSPDNFGRLQPSRRRQNGEQRQPSRVYGSAPRTQHLPSALLAPRNITERNERLRQRILSMGRRGGWSKGREAAEIRADNAAAAEDNDNDVEEEEEAGAGMRPDTCSRCFHSDFPVLLDPPSSYCRAFSADTVVLLLISSAPPNADKRQAIRDTWGSGCRERTSRYRCLFVLGDAGLPVLNEELRKESEQHGDVLQFGFKDAYSNLTYKTLSSLRWAAMRCSQVRYVMKTDDDMYVNTELIPRLLEAAAVPAAGFVGGYCWGRSSPNRDFRSKWYVPFHTFRHAQFPPMCSGTGYVLSRDVVRKVLEASGDVPFFHLEDVYVALCLQRQGVRPVRLAGFNNVHVAFDACQYRRSVMTSHEVPAEQLRVYWLQAQRCPGELPSGKDLFLELPYPPT